jgi:hypothetical protein
MPAVPFIISFAVEEAIGAMIAEEVGSAILGKAITSGISGAISSAVQGGDVAQGAEKGLVGGLVGGAVGEAVSGAPAEIDPVTGVTEAPATGLAATDIPTEYAKPITRGATAASSALARGQSPKQALVGGLVTGGLDYAYSDQPSDYQTSAEKAVIGKSLTDLFAPSTQYRTAQTEGGGTAAPTSVTTTGAGQAPGSQALAQALRIGDPGAPILGSSDKETGDKQSGWNVSSLRYMGQES